MKFSPRIVLLVSLLVGMILVARAYRPQLFCELQQQKATLLSSPSKHRSLIAQVHAQKKKLTSSLSQEQKNVAALGIPRVPAPLDALSPEELLHFPGATLVDSEEIDGSEPGQHVRSRLLKTHMKYPLIRTEEIIDAENHLLTREEMVATHVLLTLPEGIDPKDFLKKFGVTALSIESVSSEVSLYRLELASSSLEAVPEALVRVVELGVTATIGEPDRMIHSCSIPNDPAFFIHQWQFWEKYTYDRQVYDALNLPQAWNIRTDASSVIVAVVDTGIRYTHQDLAGNMWHNPAPTSQDKKGCDQSDQNQRPICCGISAADGNGNPMDKEGHGTSCAGIIGAVGNNGIGMTGICWKVQLMACQYASTGRGASSDVIVALNYAITHHANIINCSFGSTGSSFSQAEFNTLNRAREQGIIVVCAAGNDALNEDEYLHFPSSYQLDNIVSVAATTWGNTLADFSNYGAKTVHLAAPGDYIYSTSADSDSSYTPSFGGTSAAAPHVTGALALLMAQYPHRSHQELIQHLLATTTKVPALAGRTISGGMLNVGEALTRPLSELSKTFQ